jgi:hypothetical protein
VIYEHGEPWWHDIDGGNSHFIHQGSLAVLAANQEELGKGNYEFGHAGYLCSYFEVIFLHTIKSYNMGPTALLLLQRKAYCGFLLPLRMYCFDWV